MARPVPLTIDATRRRLGLVEPPQPATPILDRQQRTRRALVAGGAPTTTLDRDGVKFDRAGGGGGDDVWRFYDGAAGGETRFYVTRIKNLSARVKLVPLVRDGGEWIPDEDPAMVDLVGRLEGPHQSQAELFARAAALQTLVGHCALVGIPDERGEMAFEIASPKEIRRSGNRTTIQRSSSGPAIELPSDATVSWLWRSSLARGQDPDSGVAAALPILRTLERLQLAVGSMLDSHLVGAGLLLIASEIDRSAPDDGAPVFSFADELAEVMTGSLADQDTAAARVPITVEVAHRFVADGMNHLDFSRPLDEQLLPQLQHWLVRLARAYDLPDEVLVPGGTTDLNHWSAWYIGAQEFTHHLGPMFSDLTAGLTRGWYRPILADNGIDPKDRAIGFDPRDVLAEPDELDRVARLFPMGLLSRDKAAEMVGLDPTTDLPEEASVEEDPQRAVMLELAKNSSALAAVMPPRLGFELSDLERAALLGISPQLANPPSDESTGPIDTALPVTPPAPPAAPTQPAEQGPPNGGEAPDPPEVTASAAPAADPRVAAVQAIVDAAAWAAWRVGGQRAARACGQRQLLDQLPPEDVARRLGRPLVEASQSLAAMVAGPHMTVAERQLLALLHDPRQLAAAGRLLRDAAVEGLFAPRADGDVHAASVEQVAAALS